VVAVREKEVEEVEVEVKSAGCWKTV